MVSLSHRLFLSEDVIQARVRELGQEICEYYQDQPVIVLGIMNGALFFLVDLLRQLSSEAQVQCLTLQSYEGTKSTGLLQGLEHLPARFEGKSVLIVDDVLDSGLTLSQVQSRVCELGASEVRSCVLLEKKTQRKKEVQAHWVGFRIENEFVIGYGLDYEGKYRSFPDIRIMETESGPLA